MEAAGLASSIITFLDLTAKVIVRSQEYLSRTQNGPDYLRAIDVQLPLLARALESIKRQALSRRIAPDISAELVKIVNNASDELKRLNHYVILLTSDDHSSKLHKINRAVQGVLKYDAKIQDTLDKLKGYTETLNFFQTSVATGKTEDILGYLRLIQHGQLDLKLQYERDKIRNWLGGKPRDDYIDTCIARRAPDTCDWIFTIPAYTAWLSTDSNITDPHFLWLRGPPGVGKTFISANVFARIEASSDATAAVFWTSEGAFANTTLTEIPRSWIAQLLTKNLNNCEYVQRVWSNSKSDTASATEVWSALKNLLTSSAKTVTLVIDGLDEYQQQQAQRGQQVLLNRQQSLQYISIKDFLATLKSTLRGIPCRVLCVSQPDSEINSELEASKLVTDGFPRSFEHSITKSDIQKDIDTFARYVINGKLPKKSEQFRADLSALVASKAEGQMLWIALQERESNQLRPSFSEKKLRQVVESTPGGLDQLYRVNLERINQLGPDDKRRAWRLLNWIMHSLRPLTVHEIVEAILIEDNDDFEEFPDDELPEDPDEDDVYGELRNLCGNFIAFDHSGKDRQPRFWRVRFAHSSVRKFLSQHLVGNSSSAAHEATHNTLLAKLCVRYLMYDNVWPKVTALEPERLTMETHPFLTYAATYFILHVNIENRQYVEALLRTFLLSHYDNYASWQTNALTVRDAENLGLAPDKEAWHWKTRLTLAAALGLTDVIRALCKSSDAVDVSKSSNSMPLQAASWSGSLSAVQILLDQGFQVNQRSDDGTMALHIAASRGNLDIVELLVSNGAALDELSTFGSPLHCAALFGQELVAETLIQHNASLMLLDYDGCLPLHIAIMKGHKGITRALLRSKKVAASTVNEVTDRGASPLLMAVELGDRDLIEILLQHGGNPTQLGDNGKTPLSLSAYKGKEDVFDLLLGACADISSVVNRLSIRQNGASLLHLAVEGRSLNIVRRLVEQGADTTKLDYHYRTPLDWAINYGCVDIVEFLFAMQQSQDSGLRSWRPIHYACNRGHKDLVEMLIGKGADLKARTQYNCTALELAVWAGSLEVVQLILKHKDGKDTINHLCYEGHTPLTRACGGAHIRIMEVLLDNGADISITSLAGHGPMSQAAYSGNKAAVQTLLNRCGSRFPEKLVLHWAAYSGSDDVFELVSQYYKINDETLSDGSTLMHCAAWGGNVEIINRILNAGNSEQLLRRTTRYKRTVLSFLMRKKNIEAAKTILKRCAQLSPPAPFDHIALFEAIYEGNLEMVELFYQTTPEDFMKAKYTSNQRTPLQEACLYGQAEIMQFLIDKGFKILDCDTWNQSCLHYFAESGYESVAHFFRDIDWKAGLQVVSKIGYTPLLQAAYGGHSSVVRRFLRHGASISDRVRTCWIVTDAHVGGNASLHLAALSGDREVAEIIMETYGKDCLEWKNDCGAQAVHVAAQRNQHLFLEYLYEHGAKMDVTTFQKETPLFLAVVLGREAATSFLLGKEVASLEKRVQSPIMAYAACHAYPYVVKCLLNYGFDLDIGRKDAVTPLHLAAGYNSADTVKFLLDRGLEWDARDSHGWTARDCLESACLKNTMLWKQPVLEQEMSSEPRCWLKCSGWAFDSAETSWFVQHGASAVAKIRGKSGGLPCWLY